MTMSKIARKRRTCERKVHHANELEALIARTRMGARAISSVAYRCEVCGGWHLGNLVAELTPTTPISKGQAAA